MKRMNTLLVPTLLFLAGCIFVSGSSSININVTSFPENVTTSVPVTQKIQNNNPLDFKKYPGLVFVFVASFCGSVWLFFITFFNSRLTGVIVTKLLNKFFIADDSYVKLGSFSFSLLSGKIMFRDVKYITKDYSIRVVDGFAIFGWWLRYTPDEEDENPGATRLEANDDDNLSRLTIQLNGFEAHLYNRSGLYDRLQELFKNERYGDARKSMSGIDVQGADISPADASTTEKDKYQWGDLIPSVRFNINSGKVALGNKLLETTFWIHCNSASGVYSTAPAASSLDEYTHVVKCRCEDIRIMLSQSPGYAGNKAAPPRFMGEGFVVLQSGEVKLYYYQDVPGVVPEDQTMAPDSDPIWTLNAVFTKATTVTYGPWADKQREKLQKLFLPSDYQEQQAARPLQPGEKRTHPGFDLKLKFQAEVTMDILFSKDDETSAIHVCAEQSSYIHFYMPWTVNEFGYTSTMIMQLQRLEITTSLEFRKVLECQSMEAEIIMTVPRIWNQFQRWSCEFLFNETTLYFIYQHTTFIQDLLNDWSVTEPADIAYFVPYEWEFKFHFKDYELVCLVNEHNWIDSTNDHENSQLAFCGEALEVTFLLPFTQFLPNVENLRFFCRAESLILRLFLPESNTLRRSVLSLTRNSDQHRFPSMSRINSIVSDTDEPVDFKGTAGESSEGKASKNFDDPGNKGWRRKTGSSSGWVDVCSTPVLVLNIFYRYHLIHASNEYIDQINKRLGVDHTDKEPSSLDPDLITVELEAGPLSIKLLGSLFRQFVLGFKENYFGVAQKPSEFNAVKVSTHQNVETPKEVKEEADPRHYRPMHANITVVLLDIKAELTKHCSFGEPASPMLNIGRLTFEMNKTYKETRLQLITSPATIVVKDSVKRQSDHAHLSRGFLSLSGLQFRGHAFFSDKDVPLGSDTVEYAWLMEIQCGKLSGKLTLPQLQSVMLWAEVFGLHLLDEENVLKPPSPDVKCQHGSLQKECKQFEAPSSKDKTDTKPMLCPTEAEIKYKMTRFSLETLNLFIVEAECACNVRASPIRISSCTAHTNETSEGCSFFLNDLTVKQYVQDLSPPEEVELLNGDTRLHSIYMHSMKWIEVAVAAFGPITADITTYSHDVTLFHEQQNFLRKHDRLLKKLWFLWNPNHLKNKIATDRSKSSICGCVGGCRFFGNNVNGVKFFTTQVLDAEEKKFGRYGSESIWGGANERQGIGERLRQGSLILSSVSIGESSLAHRKVSGISNRKSIGRIRNLDSDSVGVWSSSNVSGSLKYSEAYRGSIASKLPQDRSRPDMRTSFSSSSRPRTESEGTFYSCESVVMSNSIDLDSPDAKAEKGKARGSNISMLSGSSLDSYISAVSSKEDLVSFDVTDGPQIGYKPLIPPALASLYGEHLRRTMCSNWKHKIPEELHRRYSLMDGLKSIRSASAAALPNFHYEGKGKLPFVIVSKSNLQNTADSIDRNDEPDSDSVFHHYADLIHGDAREGLNGSDRTVMNIKIHKSIDLIVTPIVLQTCERYIQSLKSQEKVQHPAYIMDSLHSNCISSSKQKHDENRAFQVLEDFDKEESRKSAKAILSTLFPRSNSATIVNIPQVNLVSLQVSAEPFNASEQSSLSGQIGSKFSADFESPKRTCTVALAASVNQFKMCHVGHHQHDALKHLTLSLLQRRSVFRSKNDFLLLKQLHDVTDDSYDGVEAGIDSINIQLQRMDHDLQDAYSGSVTAVPNSKTMVPFSVHRGDDVDVDDLSWLEHKVSEPVGKIIMECGARKVTMNAYFSERLRKILDKDTGDKGVSFKERDTLNKGSADERSFRSRTESKRSNVNARNTNDEDNSVLQEAKAKDTLSIRSRAESKRSNTAQDAQRLATEGSKTNVSQGHGAEDIELHSFIGDDETSATSPLLGRNDQIIGDVRLEIHESESGQFNVGSVDDDHSKHNRFSTNESGSFCIPEFTVKEIEPIDFTFQAKKQGEIQVQSVWLNLAHPTRLKVLQEGNDHCVNLVTSIVPSVCCWIPAYVDLMRVTDAVRNSHKKQRYSLLACAMAQSLPDKGKLLVKHNTNSMCTDLSAFLQEEHSSQLIYVLRRQMTGSRLLEVENSLEDKTSLPRLETLEKGIHALARQWNAVIISSTRKDILIKPDSRKHVVGRGVLTRKDREILKQSQNVVDDVTRDSMISHDQTADVNLPNPTSEAPEQSKRESKLSSVQYRSLSSSQESVTKSLLSHRSSRASSSAVEFVDENEKKREDLNLYDWLSSTNSPRQASDVAKSPVPNRTEIGEAPGNDSTAPATEPRKKSVDLFHTMSPMVSFPTSGMQLENAREIFGCIFDAVGLSVTDTHKSFKEEAESGKFSLKRLTVHIVSAEDTDESQDEVPARHQGFFTKTPAALCLEDLKICGNLVSSNAQNSLTNPSNIPSEHLVTPRDIKLDISLGEATQVVNIALIRLLMQITETIDVIEEENRFAKKIKSLELVGSQVSRTGVSSDKSTVRDFLDMPKNWRTMYHILQLYSSCQSLVERDRPGTGCTQSPLPTSSKFAHDVRIDMNEDHVFERRQSQIKRKAEKKPPRNIFCFVGTVRLAKIRLLAYIGGMDLETELNNLNASYLSKTDQILPSREGLMQTRKSTSKLTESNLTSASIHLDGAKMVLTESLQLTNQNECPQKRSPLILKTYTTIVTCTISKSHALFSSKPLSRLKVAKRSYVLIGAINVDIPQHPGILRSVTARFTKRLERRFIEIDNYRKSKKAFKLEMPDGIFSDQGSLQDSILSECVVLSFRAYLNSVTIGAVLLPSLRVEYKIGKVSGHGNVGPKTTYHIKMPCHGVFFESKATDPALSTLPSSTSVELPPITARGEYVVNVAAGTQLSRTAGYDSLEPTTTSTFLKAIVDIGHLEQNLTTDLLNQLIFLQKGFIKEVNQVIKDVDENDPIPLWRTASIGSIPHPGNVVPLLYSIQVNLKGIQITATTPSSTAIRLHTGIVALELSNRSPNKEKKMQIPKRGSYMKLFGRAEVDLMVSLGQCNQEIFAESDDNFESFAYFKTRVGLSNILQDKPIFHHSQDKETVIITINKPQIFLMPLAVDKGLLVYLHYKNAYDHWLEHTAEVQKTAQHIWNRLPQRPQPEKLHGSLFLQLNVEKLGLSIPLNDVTTQHAGNRSSIATTPDCDLVGPALVMTVEETTITCCSSGSFVSRGLFRNFCVRFAKVFDDKAEDWSFPSDDIINTCSVPEGSYYLCSRTVNHTQSGQTDKWLMSIFWRMCGVEVHFDSNIGKLLSSLGNALTAFAGDVDVADLSSVADAEDDAGGAFIEDGNDGYDEIDASFDESRYDRLANRSFSNENRQPHSLERQLWKQTKIVSELRQADAPIDIINREVRLLKEIESALSNEFFKDVRKRLRRHARKPSARLDRLQTPTLIRNLNEDRGNLLTPKKLGFRRHSSVERYLETKELENMPKQTELADDLKKDKQSLFVDNRDAQGLDYVDFSSNPELSNSNYDLETKRTPPTEWKRAPSHNTPRVTFSESTADVKMASENSQRSSTSTASMLDFVLDVVVEIDSGKCVLHSEVDKEEEDDSKTYHSRDGGALPGRRLSDQPTSQLKFRKERFSLDDLRHRGYTKSKRSSKFQPQNTSAIEDTVILVPGVNVRVHYQSKTTAERFAKMQTGSCSDSASQDPPDSGSTSSSSWKAGSKSAGLHAWLSIQQLPREMIVLPSLLDFLEKALEPMAIAYDNNDDTAKEGVDTDSTASERGENGTESMLSSSASDQSSFPVDVIVFINIQPSDVRFSCAPISKVECLLRVPSLDFVISSTSSPSKHSMGKSTASTSTKKSKQSSFQKGKASPSGQELTELDSGGFCVTACLSRFSFCIFHPYGKQYGSTSERSFLESGLFPGRRKKRGIVPQPISGRKDSLSLNVEFIKFNLFRKRVKACANTTARGRRVSAAEIDSKTEVKVSLSCDIGSAAFNYDMRRLNEILDVPKAWYKRELFRRMFLGKSAVFAQDTSRAQQMSDSSMSPATSTESSARSVVNPLNRSSLTPDVAQRRLKTPRKNQGHRRTISGASFLGNIMGSPKGLFLPRASASVGSRADFITRVSESAQYSPRLKQDEVFGNSLVFPKTFRESIDETDGSTSSSSKQTSEWKTHVLVAVNLSRMDVATNMGNVMGHSVWSTNDLQAQSHTLVSNTGIKSTDLIITVRQGSFDAHGGIIGGYIDVHNISAKGRFEESLGQNPAHNATVMMKGAELRVDYMGSCILMATLSGFKSGLHDDWVLPQQDFHNFEDLDDMEMISLKIDSSSASEVDRKTEIKVSGEMGWNELQIVMSRSTTPDLVKMLGKLQDFFNQQQRSGMHAFSGSRTLPSSSSYSSIRGVDGHHYRRLPSKDDKFNGSDDEPKNDGLKYQHWVEILNAIPGLELTNLKNTFQDKNVTLGGSLTLKSNFVSLACFHGSNFRAQTWALFSINEPIIRFLTDIQSVEKSCQVERACSKQDISISLGHGGVNEPSRLLDTVSEFMATVRKVSRNRSNPPSLGSPVTDWLLYVTATSEEYSSTDTNGRSSTKPPSTAKRVSFAPKVRYENDSEIVFGLPCLALRLTTEHDQPMTTRIAKLLSKNKASVVSPWLSTVPSPHVVEASLTSFFSDSLSVTMDAGLLFFLHDLILTYMKEKDAVAVVASQSGRPYRSSKPAERQEEPAVDSPETKGSQVDTPKKKEKYRHFRCKTWKLEPAIRLLGWAGARMDPVSIDWVLEKLGFMHAALTIPKWLQRGAMDPMDIALSLLLKQLLVEMEITEAAVKKE